MENFVAIGADEMGNRVKKGDRLTNTVNGKVVSGILKYGTDASTGKESDLLGIVEIYENGKAISYLATVASKLVGGWELAPEENNDE